MAKDPEEFLSFVPGRRAEWKSHAAMKNVRNVIRVNGLTSGLRLYALADPAVFVDDDGDKAEYAAYLEIPPAEWDTYFSDAAA